MHRTISRTKKTQNTAFETKKIGGERIVCRPIVQNTSKPDLKRTRARKQAREKSSRTIAAFVPSQVLTAQHDIYPQSLGKAR